MDKKVEQSLVDKRNEFFILTKESIQEKIYVIRGERVMLDFELAEIYGYSTKNFNQQINRNIERFEGLIFKLEKYEIDILQRSHFATSGLWASGKGGRTYLPYAFTEQGVYMLMTVLRSKLAIEQSRKLISLFKDMKDYIVDSNHLLTTNEILKLSNQVHENTNDIKVIKNQLTVVMDNFIDPSKYKEILIMNGQKYEAELAYQELFKMARKSIILIDDYISLKTLDLFRVCSSKVHINIYSDDVNKQLTPLLLNDYISETNIHINIYPSNNLFHDRYIFIDEKYVYISGPSLKDAGNKISTIMKSDDYDLYKQILDKLGYK